MRLGKGDFIGREALVRAKAGPLTRKLACLLLDDPTAVVLGNEPILCDGRVVGRVTSGGYGFTVKRSIAYGYLPIEFASPGQKAQVAWFGEKIRAVIASEPLYDPKASRVKETG